MMKVCYSEMDTPAGLSCRLEADGHAGYAPAGQDIVCAGASTVMQGLVYLLAGEENAHSEAFDEPDGPRLAVSVDAPCEEWVRGAFELAKACFVLLAERYPENVRFADVSRRGKESMMDLQLFAAEATAACGGNREPRLGQRPAGCKRERSRRWEPQPVLACGETLQNYCGQNVRSSFVFPAAVDWEGRTTEGRQSMAGRRYCKNTVKGSQRGRKYPPKVRAEVLMAMLSSGSICAVARRYGVPESTIRSWLAEEAGRSDAFAKERQAAAREIAIRASLGARAQVSYLQSRVDESQRAAQVRAKLHRKLDEDTRARCFAVGTLLKSDAEELADATETGLVLYAAEDSYDRQLDSEERKLLDAQLERYGERVMSDKNAAAMATVLMTVAEKAAAMVPSQSQSEGDAPPLVEIGAEGREEKGPEVMVDGA